MAKKQERTYYVATDLQSMESEIFTTKSKAAEFLDVSVDTISRRLKEDWRYLIPGKFLLCETTITKKSNKGTESNLVKVKSNKW